MFISDYSQVTTQYNSTHFRIDEWAKRRKANLKGFLRVFTFTDDMNISFAYTMYLVTINFSSNSNLNHNHILIFQLQLTSPLENIVSLT